MCVLHTEVLQAAKTNSVTPELIARVEQAVAKDKLHHLLKETAEAINETGGRVGRIRTIVQAMKYFSHPGSKNLAHAISTRPSKAR